MGKNKDLLDKLDLKPSKRKGQNFLLSENDAENLVSESGLTSNDIVIEIGPGLGALTKFILKKCGELHAIEIEKKVASHLSSNFDDNSSRFKLYIEDFRTFDPAHLDSDKIHLISNVPYVYSTELLLWMVKHRAVIKNASLLLQKEFAERICAKPGTKAYGSLSIYVQLFYEVRLGMVLSGAAFYPKASVDSQQIHLLKTEKYASKVTDFSFFEKVVRASFSMRRKMLMNCLLKNGLINSRNEGEELFRSINIDLKARAEDLSIDTFISLSNSLYLIN